MTADRLSRPHLGPLRRRLGTLNVFTIRTLTDVLISTASRGIELVCLFVGRGYRTMGMLDAAMCAAFSITWVAGVVIFASRLGIGGEG